ncbi:unnamed protein product [Brachionus calyciflorus]|uniref:Uncharacterized protein n=1 Tax=Brachionus calyciflorus TaxID=104777 RepID=A0A814FY41_9BILA|nr:unnamed protein product [Brachionus calyciflorus]
MVQSIIINREALAAMSYESENSTIKDKVLDNSEIKQMEEFMKLFENLRDINEIFSGQLFFTISLIFPIIYSLMNYELRELNINSYELQTISNKTFSPNSSDISSSASSSFSLENTPINTHQDRQSRTKKIQKEKNVF